MSLKVEHRGISVAGLMSYERGEYLNESCKCDLLPFVACNLN